MASPTCCRPGLVSRRLPVLAWLPRYSVQWLRLDVIAGLSVGLTVIPQALAYAEVAGLPSQVSRLVPHSPTPELCRVQSEFQRSSATPPNPWLMV